jgi:two-component system chemotaxis sensor kinase CheA
MMNLVGELVLARNQILQCSSSQSDATFFNAAQRLNLITTELQEGLMKTRMQPTGNVWGRFPRLVRDLALQCGKQVTIEMEGSETELDKTINEAIKDPLTHILRNSLDHGIETPEQRVSAGKPASGRLHLRAYHEGGQVNIEISDDGAGIDLERVKQKALQRGVIGAQQADRMSDREMINLVFLPGFSTAEKVSNVSGRGVGMDVVKTNIEKIGGTVDLQSVRGQGNHPEDQDSAYPRHHSRARRLQRRRTICHSAGQLAGAGAAGGFAGLGRDRAYPGSSGASLAWTLAAAGVPQPGAGVARHAETG